jgi:dienelactone hydrolase
MKTETIEYKDGALSCKGTLIYDDTKSGRRPGIVVAHDIRGSLPRPKGRPEQLASMGYAVFLADMYGGGTTMRDFPHGMELIKGVRSNNAVWRGRIRAALDTLAAQPQVDKARLGAIGYCFGGSTVLELAFSGAEVRAVVSFHGGLDGLQLQDAKNTKAKILSCTGADDPLIPLADVQAFEAGLREARVPDWEVVVYGNTKHSFTDPETPDTPNTGYNKAADTRSWAAMTALFQEAFA